MFAAARRNGNVWDLDRACRVAALRAIAEVPQATRRRTAFFLNVSPDVFEDPRFAGGFTLAALEELEICQSNIVIEITEQISITDYQRFETAIHHYARQGFRIALDDFGSGHSGLVTLLSCQPHYLKLDMAITRDIHRDAYKQMIVKSVVALAANINAELIAEGVENWDELESLTAHGVRFAQGFVLGRPTSRVADLADDVRRQLESRGSRVSQRAVAV
jgi:EAL domain-containing protein (putative c-di-GMP-specific phosphodiesterase class I)